jgi:hypothetical protein
MMREIFALNDAPVSIYEISNHAAEDINAYLSENPDMVLIWRFSVPHSGIQGDI